MAQADGGRVGPGGYLKIVLQLLLGIFVEARVYARPQPGVVQLPVAAYAPGPVRRVGPQEVVAPLGGGPFRCDAGRGRACKAQVEGVGAHGGLGGWVGAVAG